MNKKRAQERACKAPCFYAPLLLWFGALKDTALQSGFLIAGVFLFQAWQASLQPK